MKSAVRVRFWAEAGLASLCGLLAVLTLVGRDWIEAFTGFAGDHHDGSLEWMIVVGLFFVCAAVSFAARAEWRRPRSAVVAGT